MKYNEVSVNTTDCLMDLQVHAKLVFMILSLNSTIDKLLVFPRVSNHAGHLINKS